MRNWIIALSPESFETACNEGFTRVGERGRKVFTEKVGVEDRFIVYLTQKKTFDAFGNFTSGVIEGSKNDKFPWKRKITIKKKGLRRQATELFWGMEEFNTINTAPGNLLTIKGGLMEVSGKNFDWLLGQITE